MQYINRNRVKSMIGRVDEFGTTSSGGTKVKVSGKWLYPGRLPIDGMTKGMEIEYFTGSFKTADGKVTLTGLESWAPAKPLPVASTPTDGPPVVPQGSPQIAANAALRETINELSGDELRFISNCVGQALAGGACKAQVELSGWVLSAYHALQHLKAEHKVKF